MCKLVMEANAACLLHVQQLLELHQLKFRVMAIGRTAGLASAQG